MNNLPKDMPIAITADKGIIYSYFGHISHDPNVIRIRGKELRENKYRSRTLSGVIDTRNIQPLDQWHKNSLEDGFVIEPDNIYMIVSQDLEAFNGGIVQAAIELESIGVSISLFMNRAEGIKKSGYFTAIITTIAPVKVYPDTVWGEIIQR